MPSLLRFNFQKRYDNVQLLEGPLICWRVGDCWVYVQLNNFQTKAEHKARPSF